MRPPLRLVLLSLLLTGLAAAPAAAVPSMSATTKVFDVKISGSHAVVWNYASALDRPNCTTWAVGKGKLLLQYETARKARYELTEVRRNDHLVELRWGASRYRPLEFTITQRWEWTTNNGLKLECTPCGQLSEYGPCRPDPPAAPKPSCPRREAGGVIDTEIFREVRKEEKLEDVAPPRLHGPGILVEARYSEDPKEGIGCYPQAGGKTLPLPQPAALVLGANRLREMKRGEAVNLTGSRYEYVKSDALQDGDRCGETDGLLKMNACGRTRIAFDVKRVR